MNWTPDNLMTFFKVAVCEKANGWVRADAISPEFLHPAPWVKILENVRMSQCEDTAEILRRIHH